MADLLVPDGDTDRPARASAGGSVVDRAESLRAALSDDPADADRADHGAGAAEPPDHGIAIAQVPEWVIERVDQVLYPTRMARRRALEAARIVGGWDPDPSITAPVLSRFEDELKRLLDRQYEPTIEEVEPADALDPADADETTDVGTAGAETAGADPTRPHGRSADLLPLSSGGHRRWRRWVAVAAAAAVVAAGTGVALTHRATGRSTVAAPTQAAPTQQVVALALARDGELTGVSLLASGDGSPQQVLVPSRLLLDVPGAGRLPVAQSLAPGSSAPGAALADALEIKVAGTWVLSDAALAALVDSVGGVTVDVDVDVPQGPEVGAAILVPQGTAVRLNGTQAAAYAQLLVDDEPEAVRLARQERVITQLLAALPADQARRRAFIVGLPGAPTGTVLNSVVAITGALRDPAAQDELASTVVPVRDIDTGGVVTAYGLDNEAAATLVQARLAGAAIAVPAGGRLRVLVQNGDGAPGLGDEARSRLVAAGLQYVGGGNVDGFGVDESVVLLPDGTSVSRARGLAVTRALGLSEAALRISDSSPTVADVVVVLGRDFPQA